MRYDRASQELGGRERRDEDVVDSEIEGLELRRKVPAARQPQDWRVAALEGVGRSEANQELEAVVVVHVDHGHVGLPLGQDALRLGHAAGRPHHEHAVVQGELDQIDDDLVVVQHQRPLYGGTIRW